MRFDRRPTALVLLAAALGLMTLAWSSARPAPTGAAQRPAHPVLVPFAVDAAVELGTTAAQLLVAHVAEDGAPIVLEGLSLSCEGRTLYAVPLAAELAADPLFGYANELVERLPREVTELHRPRAFAPVGAPEFAGAEVGERLRELHQTVDLVRQREAAGAPRGWTAIEFPLPLDQVFFPEEPPGSVKSIEVAVDWRDAAGALHVASAAHAVERRAPRGQPNAELLQAVPGISVHAGDLHVHTCHGEASGACAPSANCTAESLQLSGSFSLAALRTQYEALGLEWFTATDHSYCINSPTEFAQIAGECAAASDAGFLVLPHTELSSDEEGPQSGGTDVGDLACLFGTNSNHMGAHFITSQKPGGSDGFLGFCNGLFNDALQGMSQNMAAIRAEGGFPIANHPSSSSWGWNSVSATDGIEANELNGVEIWNGAAQSGQGGHVASWVKWLLAGRIMYAYSGSDTHDAAFAFGANCAVLFGAPFSAAAIESALRHGSSYVSNGPFMLLEVPLDGAPLYSGAIESLPAGHAPATLLVNVHYDFGAGSGTISLFKGRVGDAAESLVCQSGTLGGSSVFQCSTPLELGAQSWLRAYGEGSAGVVYTNPVFFRPGGCSTATYGGASGGANVASLASPSSPTVGGTVVLQVGGLAASPFALIIAAPSKLDPGLPFAGGFLLVGLPPVAQAFLPAVGGNASFAFGVPLDPTLVGASLYWQAGGLDPAQVGGLAFTNGLETTFCGL
jgi:hypothetical protein